LVHDIGSSKGIPELGSGIVARTVLLTESLETVLVAIGDKEKEEDSSEASFESPQQQPDTDTFESPQQQPDTDTDTDSETEWEEDADLIEDHDKGFTMIKEEGDLEYVVFKRARKYKEAW
jgi:hypothetical protein